MAEPRSAPAQSADKPTAPPPPPPDPDLVPPAVVEKKCADSFRKGVAEGRAKAEEDFGAATRALLNCCQQLDTVRETIIANSGQELREFALAIAERILRISLREQDHTIVATIEEALQRAVKSDLFTISLHPDDYATVSEKSAELVASISGLTNLVLKQDSTIERGGARLESDSCTIDADIVSQFETIRAEVRKQP